MRNAETADEFEKASSPLRVSLFDDIVIDGIGLAFEHQAQSEGYRFVAGLDEVGRGCLAGPVVAAACILDITKPLPAGIDDSKKLTAPKRERIAEQVKAEAIAYAIGEASATEIDEMNILEATKLAMLRAIEQLSPAADYLLIDALSLKRPNLPQKAIIKGDSISASIAAASIVAKTYRDELMTKYHEIYPNYGFASHKGYGAAVHLAALREFGPCPLHRLTFRGVVS